MSGTDIFLSYARQDRQTARTFAEALAGEGFSVWWDASLHSGETFDEVIEQKLRAAGAVVVLWSPNSVASRWVRAEATLADRRKKLAPAIIEPCDRPIIFELTHAADLCEWAGDVSDPRWRSFVEDLHRLVGDAAGHDSPAIGSSGSHARPDRKVGRDSSRYEPVNPRPLRPGSDDLIFADTVRRTSPVRRPVAAETIGEDPTAHDEVHCLEIEAGDLPEELIVVESPGVKIGRTAPATVVLSHKSVSREHCIVGLANDELLVTDLNSTNGTYVDGERITRATILPVGSVLRIGQISMRHEIRDRGEAERRCRRGEADNEEGLEAGPLAATR